VFRISASLFLNAVLALFAVVFGALGASGHWDTWGSNNLFFVAWCAAVLLLFVLALRLHLRTRGPRYQAVLWNALLAGAAIFVACLANVAVFRHDAHFDVSHERANTPPQEFEAVLAGLPSDISLTYFYNAGDENALKAVDLLTIASRENQRFHFLALDLDKTPATAREFGVHAYNTAVLQARDRRVVVDNTVDLAQVAYAALRVLRKQADVICLVTGHGEGVPDDSTHVHYSHVETLQGHDVPGAGDVLEGDPDGLDRLQLALTTLGYSVRKLLPATLTVIPPDCAVVAEIGPRQALAPSEPKLLSAYLAGGGRLLLMIDAEFQIGSELKGLLGKLGLSSDPGVVIDPLNHYGSEDDNVAVPYYPPHRITNRLAMTIFPNARPIHLDPPPAGVTASILASSSKDSYLRRSTLASDTAKAADGGDAGAAGPGPKILAVAVEGHWPDAPADAAAKPFRLVFVGNSNFAANSYFTYVSNGDLAVRMVRWLAGDEAVTAVRPQKLSLERITLTREQMRNIFILVELLLPLSLILMGGMVWWRRR
jgi:ABC-2 type transport system permease protein